VTDQSNNISDCWHAGNEAMNASSCVPVGMEPKTPLPPGAESECI
jgi:hypothetical protein